MRDRWFDRVSVDYLAKGGARVSWRLRADAGPVPDATVFAIEVAASGVAPGDDWVVAAGPTANVGELVDPTPRGRARTGPVHYRVVFSAPGGPIASRPASATGILDKHDWLIAREIVRQHRLRLVKSAGIDGWLFRRRWAGPTPDPTSIAKGVVDPAVGAVVRPWAASTVGTAYSGGYFAPVPFRVDPTPAGTHAAPDRDRAAADDASLAIRGLVVAIPPLAAGDVFVASGSDRRYYVQEVADAAERRGVPILQNVELRLAPVEDPSHALRAPRAG